MRTRGPFFLLSVAGLLAAHGQAWAQTAPAAEQSVCGAGIDTNDVHLIDLEPFGEDLPSAKQFAREEAGRFEIVSAKPELIYTGGNTGISGRKDVLDLMRLESAMRGCPVVMVLNAGVYQGTLTKNPTTEDTPAELQTMGHATVLLGTN